MENIIFKALLSLMIVWLTTGVTFAADCSCHGVCSDDKVEAGRSMISVARATISATGKVISLKANGTKPLGFLCLSKSVLFKLRVLDLDDHHCEGKVTAVAAYLKGEIDLIVRSPGQGRTTIAMKQASGVWSVTWKPSKPGTYHFGISGYARDLCSDHPDSNDDTSDEITLNNNYKSKITIIKVDIKAEDGAGAPRKYVDADTDVAASYNTVKYKAVVTPPIGGTYTWSETSTKITLVNANSQTVTVNAGANASSAVDAEVLKVEFTPTGSTTTCDDAHDLTVVHCTYTAYADDVGAIGHGWWQHSISPANAKTLLQPVDIRIWANIEVGYYPNGELNYWGEAPGYVKPGQQFEHTPTSQHPWDIPFILLDNGLTYSKTLDASQGLYSLLGNNCCHKVIQAGGACGVAIPPDKTDPDKLHNYLDEL